VPVRIKTYISRSLIMLAYDWETGQSRADFAGFGIERTPGVAGAAKSWMPGVGGTLRNECYSWDRCADVADRTAAFRYRVVPVVGTPEAPEYLYSEAGEVDVRFPAAA